MTEQGDKGVETDESPERGGGRKKNNPKKK